MNCSGPRLFRHRTTLQLLIAGCMRWSCRSCIRKVARRWLAVLNWASGHSPAPEYFLTLTIREPLPLWRHAPAEEQEGLHAQAVALMERITRALSHLVEEIREQYGPMEYLATVELTTGKRTPGHRPHLHMLVRGPNVPKRWLSDRWRFYTKGSWKVDFQRLRTPEQAGEYLIGYTMLTRKEAQRAQMDNWPGPRIRYSRHFFPRPVAEIRAILWPPQAPGMWEYVGLLPWHEQLTWTWPPQAAEAAPDLALTG